MGGGAREGRRRRGGNERGSLRERERGMYDICGLVEGWYCMEFLHHSKPEAGSRSDIPPDVEIFLDQGGGLIE